MSEKQQLSRNFSEEDMLLLAEALAEIGRKVAPIFLSVSNALRDFSVTYEREIKGVGEFVLTLGQQLYVYREFQTKCRDHNLVPHKELFSIIQQQPMYFFQPEKEQSKILRNNWKVLRDKIVADYQQFKIGELRKRLFHELVSAHEHGLYMVVARAAIIEIEGLASEYCKEYANNDNVNSRKSIINGWQKTLESSNLSLADGYFLCLSFENYIQNVFMSSKASLYQEGLTETDRLLSRNFHAHGSVSTVTEKQSLNALLFLHNISSYFSHLEMISNPREYKS